MAQDITRPSVLDVISQQSEKKSVIETWYGISLVLESDTKSNTGNQFIFRIFQFRHIFKLSFTWCSMRVAKFLSVIRIVCAHVNIFTRYAVYLSKTSLRACFSVLGYVEVWIGNQASKQKFDGSESHNDFYRAAKQK